MIFGIGLTRGHHLLLKRGDDVPVFRMDHSQHSHLFGFLEHLENRRVVTAKGRSFVGHEELDRRNAGLDEGLGLGENAFLRVLDHGMKAEIHGGDALRVFLAMLGQ